MKSLRFRVLCWTLDLALAVWNSCECLHSVPTHPPPPHLQSCPAPQSSKDCLWAKMVMWLRIRVDIFLNLCLDIRFDYWIPLECLLRHTLTLNGTIGWLLKVDCFLRHHFCNFTLCKKLHLVQQTYDLCILDHTSSTDIFDLGVLDHAIEVTTRSSIKTVMYMKYNSLHV